MNLIFLIILVRKNEPVNTHVSSMTNSNVKMKMSVR